MEALVFAGARDRQSDAGTVSDWIARATSSATLTRHEVPGIGEYFECRSDTAAGGIVTHHGAIVHAMLYPVEDTAGRDRKSGGSRVAQGPVTTGRKSAGASINPAV